MAKGNRGPKCEELIEFCGHMAVMLKAGFSLEQALELLREENPTPRLEAVSKALEETGSLTGAVSLMEKAPTYFHEMIRLGEETGRLDEVLEQLKHHYERELSIRRSIRGAVAYPAMMIVMLIAVVAVLLTRVLPVFDRVFAQLGTRLTGLSRMLADLGELLRQHGLVMLLVLAALAAAAFLLTRGKGLKLIRRLPWFSRVCDLFSLCRFAGALSMVLASGVHSERALELVSGLNSDPVFGRKLILARQTLEESGDLVEALRVSRILTGTAARLAVVGQKTGTLDTALSDIADEAREEADRAVSAAIGMIEPVLVIVLSVLVGVVLLSVLMPMVSILSAL